MISLKKIIILFLSFFSFTLSAQNLTMSLKGKVKCEEADLDATPSVKGKTDSNNQLCALLKVTLTNQLNNPLVLNVGSFAAVVAREEQEDGKIWFWVPAAIKNLHFSCKGYKDMDPIPVELKNGKVYTLTIDTGAEYTTVTTYSLKKNYLKMNIEPENAIVSLGKTKEYEIITQVVNDGIFDYQLDYNTYYYKIESEFYETEEGIVTISENTASLTIKLSPYFNYLKITSTPDNGANVFVNGKNIGQTPIERTEKIKKGAYSIKLILENFHILEETINLSGDGSTVIKNFELKPQFGNVICKSDDPDAEIWVDDELKGKGLWSGRLASGITHKLESKKESHQPQSKSFTVNEGETKTETIGAPVPLYAVIQITSEPSRSKVYIDGEMVGETPLIKNNVLIGQHKIEVKKEGYITKTSTESLQHNKIHKLEVKLEKGKSSYTQKQKTEMLTIIANGVSFEMVYVKGGTFWMGAQSTNSSGHQVTLSDYYVGQTEVTQGLWKAVMGTDIRHQRDLANPDWPLRGEGDSYPMYYISWNDIQTFLSKLNSITGKTFVLPTEAQWEFAARGGTKSNGYKYSGSNTVGNVAWYNDNSSSSTHSVGTKQSNELGIYDMSGNVWEWCKDWYGSYGSSSQTNPQGPSVGSGRVLRGGFWGLDAVGCRVAYRDYYGPDFRFNCYGFRLALLP